jgi:hypothetical protein
MAGCKNPRAGLTRSRGFKPLAGARCSVSVARPFGRPDLTPFSPSPRDPRLRSAPGQGQRLRPVTSQPARRAESPASCLRRASPPKATSVVQSVARPSPPGTKDTPGPGAESRVFSASISCCCTTACDGSGREWKNQSMAAPGISLWHGEMRICNRLNPHLSTGYAPGFPCGTEVVHIRGWRTSTSSSDFERVSPMSSLSLPVGRRRWPARGRRRPDHR